MISLMSELRTKDESGHETIMNLLMISQRVMTDNSIKIDHRKQILDGFLEYNLNENKENCVRFGQLFLL